MCVYAPLPLRSRDRDGVRQFEQRGGEESARVRALRAEAQHPAAAEGLHRAAVHLPARPAHGFSQRVLRAARKGLSVTLYLCVNSLEFMFSV